MKILCYPPFHSSIFTDSIWRNPIPFRSFSFSIFLLNSHSHKGLCLNVLLSMMLSLWILCTRYTSLCYRTVLLTFSLFACFSPIRLAQYLEDSKDSVMLIEGLDEFHDCLIFQVFQKSRAIILKLSSLKTTLPP